MEKERTLRPSKSSRERRGAGSHTAVLVSRTSAPRGKTSHDPGKPRESCEGEPDDQITRSAECLRCAWDQGTVTTQNERESSTAHVPVGDPGNYHDEPRGGSSRCFLGGLVGQEHLRCSPQQRESRGPGRLLPRAAPDRRRPPAAAGVAMGGAEGGGAGRGAEERGAEEKRR